MPRRKSSAIQTALPELAIQINRLFADCEEALATAQNAQLAALQVAKECGLLLSQAKAQIPHGGWESWRKENLKHPASGKELPSSTATLYQRVADNWETIEASEVATLRDAAKLLKKPRGEAAISPSAIDALLETKAERIELVLKGKRKTLRGLGSPVELAKELLGML